ncbi:MAG: tetratricopeptide repeat protein [Desulfomonilia bacterium]
MKNRVLVCIVVLISTILIFGCAKSDEEKRTAYLESAREYMDQEKFAEAAIQFQNALQISPDDVETLVTLGEVQLKLQRPQEAYNAFLRASKADPKNVPSRQYLASMQLLAKQYELAIEQARAILEQEPDNLLAKEILAQSLFLTGKREEAVGIMEGILTDHEPTEEAIINTAQMYIALGRTDDALALVSKGSTLFPSSTKIRFLASDMYVFKKDIQQAQKWAEDAFQVDPDNVMVGVALARFYASHTMDDLFARQVSDLKTRFPDNPEPYMLESSVLRQKGDTAGALAAAEKARDMSDTTQTRTMVSQLHLEQGDKDAARKLLIQTVEEDDKAIPPRILLAQIHIDDKDSVKALEVMDVLLKSIPRRPDVATTAAQAYILKGDIKKARELVEGSLQDNRNDVSLHAMMARILFSQGEFTGALDEVNLLASNNVRSPDLLYVGALSALRVNDPAQAEGFISTLKKAAPQAWPSLHAETLLALSKGYKATAYQTADTALGLYPENPEALRLYAFIAPTQVEKSEVIKKVSGTCSQVNTPFCHMVLSGLLESNGQKEEALKQIKQAIKLDPDQAYLYHGLAQYYTRNNMLNDAVKEYEDILNKNPDDLQAAIMLALLEQNSGKIDEAKKVYTYILDKNPKHALAANNLAWILADEGKAKDFDRALQLAQTAKDAFPEDPRIADTLGYVYLKKGLTENALGQFKLALDKLPEEPSLNYHMALAMADLKRTNEAISYLKKALDSKQPFEEKDKAQALLAQLEAQKE